MNAWRYFGCVCLMSLTALAGCARSQAIKSDYAKADDTLVLQTARAMVYVLPDAGCRYTWTNNQPGQFYLLSKVLIRYGRSNDYREMIDGEDAIQKAMGLVCLTATDRRAGRDALISHVNDPSPMRIMLSCVFSDITLGEFCTRLLMDRQFLRYYIDGEPGLLLNDDELAAFSARILGDDMHVEYQASSERTLSEAVRTSKHMLRFEDEASRRVGLSPLGFIKAVGRLQPASQTRSVLMGWAGDTSLDSILRLAAASGLSRDPSKAVRHAIEQLIIDDERWPAIQRQLIADWQTEHQLAEKLATVTWEPEAEGERQSMNDAPAWRNVQKKVEILAEMMPTGHPAMLRVIGDGWNVNLASLAPAVTELSLRLDRYSQQWNVYSDTARRLQWWLTRSFDLRKPINDDEYEKLIDRLNACSPVKMGEDETDGSSIFEDLFE